MTITIADAFAHIQAQPPAPVILIDTCSFLDLFRPDETQTRSPFQPRAPHQEIRAGADLLDLATALPDAVHLIVPELVPREYADHANAIQTKFGEWTELHDRNQDWLVEASLCVALALPAPHMVHPHGLAARLRALADSLLAKARVLARDQACLDRAVYRLINKFRPSHKKEMKDSMNMEQCLALSSQLQNAGFPRSRVRGSTPTTSRRHRRVPTCMQTFKVFLRPPGSRITHPSGTPSDTFVRRVKSSETGRVSCAAEGRLRCIPIGFGSVHSSHSASVMIAIHIPTTHY